MSGLIKRNSIRRTSLERIQAQNKEINDMLPEPESPTIANSIDQSIVKLIR